MLCGGEYVILQSNVQYLNANFLEIVLPEVADLILVEGTEVPKENQQF